MRWDQGLEGLIKHSWDRGIGATPPQGVTSQAAKQVPEQIYKFQLEIYKSVCGRLVLNSLSATICMGIMWDRGCSW